jgi:hypothetical protein
MYLQAKHTSKAAFYLLQQSGIVPSYSCIRKILKNLAKETNQQMVAAASTKPSLFMHDNIKIKYGVTSQRGDNQAVSDNGTAMTLIILPESARAFEDADDFVPFYRSLKAQRIKGTAPQLNWKDLADAERHKRNRTGAIFDIMISSCSRVLGSKRTRTKSDPTFTLLMSFFCMKQRQISVAFSCI